MEISDRKIVWGLIILQLAVCLPFINSFPIALDEPFSIFYAQQDIGEFMPVLNSGNNSPLYFIVLHFWIKLFGVSAIAVRLLTLLISVLVIITIYQLVRRTTNWKAASLAGVFFIFSSFMHYHSMEVRMYMLFTLFYLLIINELLHFETSKKLRYFRLAILHAVIFHTHYLAIFVFLTELLFFILNFSSLKRQMKQAFSSIIISIVLCSPGLLVFFDRLADGGNSDSWVPRPHITEVYGNVIRFMNGKLAFIILFLIAIAVIFVFKINFKKIFTMIVNNKTCQQYFLFFFTPYICMFVFSFFYGSVFLDRYLLFCFVPLFILSALILESLLLKHNYLVMIVFTVPFIFTVDYIPVNNRSIDKIVETIKAYKLDDQKFYISPPWILPTVLYHYDLEMFADYKNIELYEEIFEPIYSLSEIELLNNFTVLLSREGTIDEVELNKYLSKSGYLTSFSEEFNTLFLLNEYNKN